MEPKLITHRERSGVVLLMSLLFMAAITASTVGVAIVITSSLKQSRNVDDYIIASLTADTGLERGLAAVAVSRGTYSIGLSDVLPCIATSMVGCMPEPGTPITTLGNGSRLTVRSSESLEPITRQIMGPSDILNFDILRLNASGPALPLFLKITGTCAESTCDNVLEVSWTLIDATNNAAFSNRQALIQTQYQSSPPCISLANVKSETSDSSSGFAGTILGFRIRVRAVDPSADADATVQNVTATAYSDAACSAANQQPILSRIRIESSGQSGSANQEVRAIKTANVLWQVPASGLLNYVVFSEQSIIP